MSHIPTRQPPAPATELPDSAMQPPPRLTMYIVLRKDLIKDLNWSTGSMIAQGAHACALALSKFKDHPDTLSYLHPDSINSMTKVVYQVKNELKLNQLSELLGSHHLDFVVWKENPEGINTALATRPLPSAQNHSLFKKHCQLFR